MTATPLPIVPRAASGFLKPVFSALQRRALRTSIIFGSVFVVGLGGICWQVYHLLPAGMRAEVLAVDGVMTALVIALLWIAVALATTAMAAAIFVRQHVSGPAAELARTHEAIAKGDLSKSYNPLASNKAVDRLTRSTMSMVSELRALTGKMRVSADENGHLATQLAKATVSAAATARERAVLANNLSHDAVGRERTIKELTTDAMRLGDISGNLREAA